MKIDSWRSAILSVFAALGLSLLPAFAHAGGVAHAGDAERIEKYAPVIPDPDEFLARSITRIALMDLRARLEPVSGDFRIASHLLGFAQEIAPDDESIVRRRLEAAWASGDQTLFMELTRRLVQLDPRDTVAQLRLISDRIKRLQTAEERIAAYERLLGERGATLDASIRSRLALDLALLLRERGREEDFVARVLEALKLDPTNKDAAALVWAYFGPGLSNPPDRFELLTNLLYADPLDPNVHRSMARLLAQSGAMAEAKRFHTIATRLLLMAGMGADESLVNESLVLDWQTSGPAKIVETLNLRLAMMRDLAAREVRDALEAGVPPETLTHPMENRLDLAFDRVRIVAAHAAGDQETITAAADDLRRSIAAMATKALDPQTLPRDADVNSIRTELTRFAIRNWIMVAWAGVADDHITQQTEAADRTLSDTEPDVRTLVAMVALAKGDAERALALFEAMPNQNDVAVMSGRARAMEALGRHDEATALYGRIATAAPLTIMGAWARVQLQRVGMPDPFDPVVRAAMVRAANAVPTWIDRMTIDPKSFMSARAEVVNREVGALERTVLRVVVQNIAPIPLAVGSERAINSRFVFSPRLDIGVQTFHQDASPEIYDLERRLRLMPGESMTFEIWPDPGYSGWLVESRATQVVRSNWRMVQGFVIGRGGTLDPGPLCLSASTGYQTRRPSAEAKSALDSLLLFVEEAPRTRFPEMVGAVRARVLGGPGTPDALTPAEIRSLAERLAERYLKSAPRERMMMLAVVPNTSMEPGMRAFDEAALNEEDPRALALVLATRAVDPNHPAFDRAEASGDALVRELASLLRERIRERGATYARAGPGGRDLAPRRLADGTRQ
ncbi:MAG: hypothetical protein KIS87_03590 [Phycisphaeraceae bacterium]|nr:hypothetical protein [Phycisphaeraceae bacterium]